MRKSLTRRLSHLSDQSHQSQLSGVLDPDSNVGIEGEGAPLWFKNLENNSTSTRQSVRFSLAQDDTPRLNSSSEPDSTPMRTSWWKNLDNTAEIRNIPSEKAAEKSVVSEKSPESMESSEASSPEKSFLKKRSALRRKKRKSTPNDMFSLISESSEDSIGAENVDRDTRDRDKENLTTSPSISGADDSVKKIRRIPFRKKVVDSKKAQEGRTDKSSTNVFQDLLDASSLIDDERDEIVAENNPQSSPDYREASPADSSRSAETIRLELERRLGKSPSKSDENLPDESAHALPVPMEDEDDDAELPELRTKSRTKKRTMFTKTKKRISPNFDDLLNDESEDESSRQISMNEKVELNENKTPDRPSKELTREKGKESTTPEDESGREDSIRKKRGGFFRKKRKSTLKKKVAEYLESGNNSDNSRSINFQNESQKKSLDLSHVTASSGVERRLTNQKIDHPITSGVLNAGAENNESESRRSVTRDLGFVNKSGEPRRSAIEKSYYDKSSGFLSPEIGKRRTSGLQIRRSVVVNKTHGSIVETNSSSRVEVGFDEKRSSDLVGLPDRENSDESMVEESPIEETGGEILNDEDIASTSGLINRKSSRGSKSGSKSRFQIKNIDNEEAGPSERAELVLSENWEKTFEGPRVSDVDFGNKKKRSRAMGNVKNNLESVEPRRSSIRRFVTSSARPANSRLNTDGASGDVSMSEQLSKIRPALEELKKKEMALMKNAKINSYFKTISKTKSDVPVQSSKNLGNKKESRGNNVKTSTARTDKAYLVNGAVYKRPKLPRPKPWATDRLYKFLWKKIEPKYNLKTRIRSEKFIIRLSEVVALIIRRKKYENYREELDGLIRDMARLGIIKTRNDFNLFCQEFLPYEFRLKVVPMILPGSVRNIPFEPNKLHEPILKA